MKTVHGGRESPLVNIAKSGFFSSDQYDQGLQQGYLASEDKEGRNIEMVIIEMDNGGVIKIELDEKAAPLTVANFTELVKEGFYDGLIFHRVIRGFMIQGGDPTGTGMGGSKKNIKGEFAANGVPNPLKHTRGVISMARAMDPTAQALSSSSCIRMHRIWTAATPLSAKSLKGGDLCMSACSQRQKCSVLCGTSCTMMMWKATGSS